MKHFSVNIVVVCFVCAFFLVACGKSPVTDSYVAPELQGAPEWVISGGGGYEGGLASVGSSEIGAAGLSFARNNARAQGRDELARQMQIKVQNMVKNFVQEIGAGDGQTVDRVSSQVSRQVAQQTLSGSAEREMWVSPTRVIHVLMVIDPSIVKEHVRDSVRTSLNNEEALWQQFQAKQGFDALDKQLEKEFGN